MHRKLLPRSLAALTVAAVTLAVAACGGSGSSDKDPASAVPDRAPVYLEAELRPEGEKGDDARALLGKLLRTSDVDREIAAILDEELKDSKEGLSFREDIDPWVGDRAAVAVLDQRRGREDPDVLVVINSRDDEKARAAIAKVRDVKKVNHRGADYYVNKSEDNAIALVDGRVLIGQETSVKAGIEVLKGDRDPLSEAKGLKDIRDQLDDDRVGLAYANVARLGELSEGAVGLDWVETAQSLRSAFAKGEDGSFGVGLELDPDALRFEAVALGAQAQQVEGEASDLLAALPEDAWLALGVGDLGKTLNQALDQVAKEGRSLGLDPRRLLEQVKTMFGIDVERDLLSWMGDGAAFVRGDAKRPGGALVIQSTDPARSGQAVARITRLLRALELRPRTTRVAGVSALRIDIEDLPEPILVAGKGDRFAIAYGSAALRGALDSGGRLGESRGFREATAKLEDVKPSLFVDTPALVKVFGSELDDDPRARKALSTLGPIAGGGEVDDDKATYDLVVGIR